MFFDALGTNRLKSSKTDMKRDLDRLDAATMEAGKNFWSEVKACSGRGDGSALVGIDGLIPLTIRGAIFSRDVGRQGNMSNAFDDGEEILHWRESDMTFAEGSTGDHLGFQFVIRAEEEMLSDTDLAAWTDKTLPFVRLDGDLSREEDLDASAEEFSGGRVLRAERLRVESLTASVKTGGKHPGVVEDQNVGRTEEVGKFAKSQILESTVSDGKTQKPGCGTVGKGHLRDQVRGKFVVKIGDEHALRL